VKEERINQEGKMRLVTTKSHWFDVENEDQFLIWLESLERGQIFVSF
jgi:hypothetical protein